MKILKYELKITDRQTIKVNGSKAHILSVAEQDGKLMMWAMVSAESGFSQDPYLDVFIIGTGNELPNNLVPHDGPFSNNVPFVGTVVMSNGLVWHVFAETISVGV